MVEINDDCENPMNKETRVVVKSLQGESRKNKLACSYDRAAAADAEGVNMPNGLGRYGVEDAEKMPWSTDPLNFEWYLKNHLGSTMLVYASGYGTPGW